MALVAKANSLHDSPNRNPSDRELMESVNNHLITMNKINTEKSFPEVKHVSDSKNA